MVCRQLGFSDARQVLHQSEFGEGYGPIWLSRVDCFGDEHGLDGCGLTAWSEGDCDNSQEAGVVCRSKYYK